MALRVAGDDAGDDVGEVGVGVEAVELAGLDERGDRRPVLAAAVGSGEERILPVQGDGSDTALDHVGVDLDAAVIEEAGKPGPAGERVADGFGEPALLADQRELAAQPRLEGLDDGSAALLAGSASLLRRPASDLALDPVEFGDAGERLRRDRRGSGLCQLVELVSSVLQFSLKVGFENSLIGIPFGSFRQG